MTVYIPDALYQAITASPEGTLVLGTYNPDHHIGSVTDVVHPENGFDCASRRILARMGETMGQYPFRISRNGGLLWTDSDGGQVDVRVYNTKDFFKRTPFNTDIMDHLGRERVLIVGTGSVGAPIGLELARSGVGTLIAVDKDILEIHNCMRHVLGTAYVGWPKPVAFQQYIRENVPTCECIPVYADIFQGDRKQLREVFEVGRPTRILAVTDSLRVQYLCQRAALHYQVPLMAVWCDNNAVEGEIFMWEPGQAHAWRAGRPERGCYACMRDPDSVTIGRSTSFDYSSDDPDTYGGEPALGTFINRINNVASIMMTAWMLHGCPVETKLAGILEDSYEGKGLQYIRLGGPYPFEAEGQVTAKHPWAVEWYRVLKNDNCSFCSDLQHNAEVLFPETGFREQQENNWDEFE